MIEINMEKVREIMVKVLENKNLIRGPSLGHLFIVFFFSLSLSPSLSLLSSSSLLFSPPLSSPLSSLLSPLSSPLSSLSLSLSLSSLLSSLLSPLLLSPLSPLLSAPLCLVDFLLIVCFSPFWGVSELSPLSLSLSLFSLSLTHILLFPFLSLSHFFVRSFFFFLLSFSFFFSLSLFLSHFSCHKVSTLVEGSVESLTERLTELEQTVQSRRTTPITDDDILNEEAWSPMEQAIWSEMARLREHARSLKKGSCRDCEVSLDKWSSSLIE